MPFRRRTTSVLVGGVAALFALPAFAADVTSTWSAATSGVWNANGNWLNVPVLGGFPNNGNGGVATYDAMISAAGSPYTVTLNTNVTVEDLTLNSANATINHTAGTFTATGAITISAGAYQLSGGTISNTVINVAGGSFLFTSSAGILSNGAVLNGDLNLSASSAGVRLQSGASFSGVANLSAASTRLVIQDTQTLTGKTINLDGSSAVLGIDGTNTVTLGVGTLVRGRGSVGQAVFVGGTGTLLNAGTIRADLGGQVLSINPSVFTNQAGGVVEATNGSTVTINSANWSNAGAINATGASTLNFDSTWSNAAGTVTIGATATLNLSGTSTVGSLGTINNSAGGTVNILGTINNAATNLAFNATTGSWRLAGGTISGGTITPGGGGQTLLFTSSAGILSNGAVLNGDLNLSASSAGVRLQSGASFSGVANLSAASTRLVIQDTQTLTGKTINLDGSSAVLGIDGTNTVTLGVGTLVRGRGSVGQAVFVGGTGTLLNAGTIRADLGGQVLSINPSVFTNQAGGVVEAVNGSTLSIPSGYTQTGGITRAFGTGTVNTSTLQLVGGSLEGTGAINATVNSTGIIDFDAGGRIVGVLNATGGAWNGQGSVSGLTTVSSGTLTIGGGANLTANGGVNVTGIATIAAAGATAKITGNVSYLSSSNSTFGGVIAGAGKTLTLNNAAVTWTLAGANTYTGATTVTAGTLKAGVVSTGTSGAFGLNSAVTMANSASAVLDLAGFNTQIGSLNGGGTSGGSVLLGSATLTFGGNNASPAVYSGNISGGGGIVKFGAGTQTFNRAQNYTGATTVGGGTLRLDFANLTTPTNLLASGSTLTLAGGNLSVLGKTGAGVVTSQSLGNVTLSTGTFSTLALDPNNSGAGSTTLTLGNNWTRQSGATLLIDYSSTNTGGRRVVTAGAIAGSGAAGPSGLFGYALVKDSGGTGFARQDGSFAFIRNTAAGTVLTTSNSVAGTTAIDFTTVSTDPGYSGGTLTLNNAAHAANTLTIDSTGGGTLNIGGASGVLALTSSAVLVQGTGNYTIQNGALGASGSEVIVHQIGTGTLTISSPVSGGAGSLTKDGTGTLTLNGAQNFATLNAGAGTTNLPIALGTGASAISANARVNIGASQTLAELNIGANGVVVLGASGPSPLLEDHGFDGETLPNDVTALFDHEQSQVSFSDGTSAQAVPEPEIAALCFAGIALLLSAQRRPRS